MYPVIIEGNFKSEGVYITFISTYTLQKKIKDICQYLDLKTKIKATSQTAQNI